MAVGYPVAEAVMVVEPAFEPVTTGAARGVVAPGAMKTVEGDTVAVDALPVASETYTPPAGAGDPRLTLSGAELPGAIVRFAGKRMPAA